MHRKITGALSWDQAPQKRGERSEVDPKDWTGVVEVKEIFSVL
jgi:hypothetical protein